MTMSRPRVDAFLSKMDGTARRRRPMRRAEFRRRVSAVGPLARLITRPAAAAAELSAQ
jgi:hypothetical protein